MCYTYDSLGRVTSRTVKKISTDEVLSSEAFTYDAAGNITGGSSETTFVYDTNNRLTEYNGNAVTYDLDGNMLSNGVSSFTYDSANKLITADGHTYTYNAENVRIRNLCTDEDTTYTYNTNCKLSKLLCKTTNGVTTKYVYGRGLIGEETNSSFKTYHFDFRGSTIAITDASGNITDTFAYDTYGKCISRTGTSNVIFGYNGRDGVVTDENGFIYMRARYYSPEMKRFVNADVVAGSISNAVTLNRFAYANGNPVSFVDPFGLEAGRGDIIADWNMRHFGSEYSRYGSTLPNPHPLFSNQLSWQELGFEYDGSMRDFQRWKQGIPPYSYEQWLKNGYGYSDEPYWDALLGNYDAIYVADYGLPAVAHAYVLLKNDDGSWIRTDFNVPDDAPNLIKKKENAHIYTYNVPSNYIIEKLSVKPDGYTTYVTTQKIDYVFGFIPVVLEYQEPVQVYTSGVQYVPLKGDFSESIELAWEYKNEKYGGYDLVTNNCAHYAQEILKEGTVYNEKIEKFLETSDTIIPADLYAFLYSYSK